MTSGGFSLSSFVQVHSNRSLTKNLKYIASVRIYQQSYGPKYSSLQFTHNVHLPYIRTIPFRIHHSARPMPPATPPPHYSTASSSRSQNSPQNYSPTAKPQHSHETILSIPIPTVSPQPRLEPRPQVQPLPTDRPHPLSLFSAPITSPIASIVTPLARHITCSASRRFSTYSFRAMKRSGSHGLCGLDT